MSLIINRETIIGWLKSNNTRFHLTLTVSKSAPVLIARSLLNKHIRQLNRAIFKKRYHRGESYLQGYAIEEYTDYMQTVHFHIMIANNKWLPSTDRFDELNAKQIQDIKRGAYIHHIKHYQVQDYYNDGTDRLEHYLTKQFENKHVCEVDKIGILSDSDVVFGGVK